MERNGKTWGTLSIFLGHLIGFNNILKGKIAAFLDSPFRIKVIYKYYNPNNGGLHSKKRKRKKRRNKKKTLQKLSHALRMKVK